MKIVINTQHGGFGLSKEAEELYKQRKGITDPDWYYWDIPRDDSVLVEIVEQMGEAANGNFAYLKIVEIPEGIDWTIGEYDGDEWVAEAHQTWR
jgi:hypothetical protein